MDGAIYPGWFEIYRFLMSAKSCNGQPNALPDMHRVPIIGDVEHEVDVVALVSGLDPRQEFRRDDNSK